MPKFKIVYDLDKCIGAGECEKHSPLWKVNNDGKSILKGAKVNPATKLFELEISEQEYNTQRNVAESCPSGCIKIVKIG